MVPTASARRIVTDWRSDPENNDGSVDTLRTLESIARVFPSLRPDQQKSVSDALGLTPEMLALMREGVRMKALLAKSDELGLTVDPNLTGNCPRLTAP